MNHHKWFIEIKINTRGQAKVKRLLKIKQKIFNSGTECCQIYLIISYKMISERKDS